MTIKQLNDVLGVMHTIYPFKPEITHVRSLVDFRTETLGRVEIATTDVETGVYIVMEKGVDEKKPWENREEDNNVR